MNKNYQPDLKSVKSNYFRRIWKASVAIILVIAKGELVLMPGKLGKCTLTIFCSPPQTQEMLEVHIPHG